MTDEKLYTLAEARREIALQACRDRGHILHIVTSDGEPVKVMCERCPSSWKVES